MQKAVFLDRDGVINIDKKYVYKIEDFEFCRGVFEALHHFQSLGYNLQYRDWETDRKSTRLNSSHITRSRMPASA